MNRLAFVASFTGALLAASVVSAEEPGWYVQGNAGASFGSRFDSSPHRDGDAGYVLSGQAGRDFGHGLRSDAELLYLDTHNAHGQVGRTSLTGGFVNGYYTFYNQGAWRPFVGVGVGVADVRSLGAGDTRFAYQAKVGVEHPFSDRLTGEVAYRYVGVTGLQGNNEFNSFHGDYHASVVTVGLRYRFGG